MDPVDLLLSIFGASVWRATGTRSEDGANLMDGLLMHMMSRSENEHKLSTKESVIASLPSIVYDANTPLNPDKLQCTICLENFIVGEEITHLPCDHYFHLKSNITNECRGIVSWLRKSNECPLCRFALEGQKRLSALDMSQVWVCPGCDTENPGDIMRGRNARCSCSVTRAVVLLIDRSPYLDEAITCCVSICRDIFTLRQTINERSGNSSNGSNNAPTNSGPTQESIIKSIRLLESSSCLSSLEEQHWDVRAHISQLLLAMVHGEKHFPIIVLCPNSRAVLRAVHRKLAEQFSTCPTRSEFIFHTRPTSQPISTTTESSLRDQSGHGVTTMSSVDGGGVGTSVGQMTMETEGVREIALGGGGALRVTIQATSRQRRRRGGDVGSNHADAERFGQMRDGGGVSGDNDGGVDHRERSDPYGESAQKKMRVASASSGADSQVCSDGLNRSGSALPDISSVSSDDRNESDGRRFPVLDHVKKFLSRNDIVLDELARLVTSEQPASARLMEGVQDTLRQPLVQGNWIILEACRLLADGQRDLHALTAHLGPDIGSAAVVEALLKKVLTREGVAVPHYSSVLLDDSFPDVDVLRRMVGPWVCPGCDARRRENEVECACGVERKVYRKAMGSPELDELIHQVARVFFQAVSYRILRFAGTSATPSYDNTGSSHHVPCGEGRPICGGISADSRKYLQSTTGGYRAVMSSIRGLETSTCMGQQESSGWAISGHITSLLQTICTGGSSYPIFGLDVNSRGLLRIIHRRVCDEAVKLIPDELAALMERDATLHTLLGSSMCLGGFPVDVRPTNRFKRLSAKSERVQQFLDVHAGILDEISGLVVFPSCRNRWAVILKGALPHVESHGWRLKTAVAKLKKGEQNRAVLCQGLDANSAELVGILLDCVLLKEIEKQAAPLGLTERQQRGPQIVDGNDALPSSVCVSSGDERSSPGNCTDRSMCIERINGTGGSKGRDGDGPSPVEQAHREVEGVGAADGFVHRRSKRLRGSESPK